MSGPLGLDTAALDAALERCRAVREAARARLDGQVARAAPPRPAARRPAPPAADPVADFARRVRHAARISRDRFPAPVAGQAVPEGWRLRDRRQALGRSQYTLAREAGLSRGALAELERRDHGGAGVRLAVAAALDRLEAAQQQAVER